jgi:hypothetical protein
MKKIIPLLLLPLFAHAEVGVGEFFIDAKNPKDAACAIAENLAIRDALRIRNGETVESTEMQICSVKNDKEKCKSNRVTDTVVTGTIDEIVNRYVHVEDNKCTVEVNVTFKTPKFLNVDVSGDGIFRNFQNISFNVQVAQPTYLYVFNIDSNKVRKVFPFRDAPNFRLDKSGVWPSSYTDKHSILALLGSGIEISQEKMVFVFTQHPVNITSGDLEINQFNAFLDTIPIESKRVLKRNIVITK